MGLHCLDLPFLSFFAILALASSIILSIFRWVCSSLKIMKNDPKERMMTELALIFLHFVSAIFARWRLHEFVQAEGEIRQKLITL